MLTPLEIIEGNEKIALFVGFQKTDLGWFDAEEILDTLDSNTFDRLIFNESWDWLIPSVEKAVSIADDDMWDEWSVSLVDVLASFNPEIVFIELVDFIQWYETNKEE